MAEPPQRGMEPSPQIAKVLRRPVGQGPVQVGPDMLRRIELRRIGREPLGLDARMRDQVGLHQPAPVDRTVVPQQDHRAPQMLQQRAEEGADLHAGEVPVVATEVESQVPTFGRDGKRRERREAIPLEPVLEDRRVALRPPGAGDGGDEQEAALVEEDQGGAESISLFLYAAIDIASTERWPLRCAGGRGAPASDSSSPIPAAPARWRGGGSGPRRWCG